MRLAFVLQLLLFSLPASTYASTVDWSEFSASALIETSRASGVFTCSGVALSPRVVLTAAHCVEHADSVRVSFDLTYDPVQGGFINVVPGSYALHPLYNPALSLYAHDLAVLTLSVSAPSSIRIQRLPPSSFRLRSGDQLERVGFGSREGTNRRTWMNAILRSFGAGNLLTQDELAVQGDSGGPVYYRDGNTIYLVATHSTLLTDPEGNSAVEVDLRARWPQVRARCRRCGPAPPVSGPRTGPETGGCWRPGLDRAAFYYHRYQHYCYCMFRSNYIFIIIILIIGVDGGPVLTGLI